MVNCSNHRCIMPIPPALCPVTSWVSLSIKFRIVFLLRAPYDWWVSTRDSFPQSPQGLLLLKSPLEMLQPGISEEVPLPFTIPHAIPNWFLPHPSGRRQSSVAVWHLGRQMPSHVWHHLQALRPCFSLIYPSCPHMTLCLDSTWGETGTTGSSKG